MKLRGMLLWFGLVAVGCFVEASVEEYCSKCEECLLSDPGFSEGFCTDWWDGTSFDYSGCVNRGDPDKIEGFVSTASIDDMSCFDFDDCI